MDQESKITKLRSSPSRYSDWELVVTLIDIYILNDLCFESSYMIELKRTPLIENKDVICLLPSLACSCFLTSVLLCPLFFFVFFLEEVVPLRHVAKLAYSTF
mgnify:CR=1 FL=1